MPDTMSAAQAILAAKGLIDTFGWPAYSPMQAFTAIEKKMTKGDQVALMWDICTRAARERRRSLDSGLHPVIEIHVQDGQTKEGITEYMLDCADVAEHHPLNGTQ